MATVSLHRMADTPPPQLPEQPIRSRRDLPRYATTNLQPGADPYESLCTVRRAVVGRWWVQVVPREDGFRAEAHTMSGEPGVWAGEVRDRLTMATADAVAMFDDFRELG